MTGTIQQTLITEPGAPTPFGTCASQGGVNFALYSQSSKKVTLCLFSYEDRRLIAELPLDPEQNRTSNVWHILVKGLPEKTCYAYRLEKKKSGVYKTKYQKQNLILDPYAKGLASRAEWANEDSVYEPLGLVSTDDGFDWEADKPLGIPAKDLIIYEMHIRGLTHHETSGVVHPGTFLGVIEKIPYLQHLGVNAIKLMPIQEFNESEYHRFNPFTGERLRNYWGYSTVNFFSPMNRYASGSGYGQATLEFKEMVKQLHKNGIEVIVDIVLNHTAEGNGKGPCFSFKGIDASTYYLLTPDLHYMNFTGCGNTFNCNHPIVREFIRHCLRYWVTEMHVDGFRFDLGGIFMRGTKGEVLSHSPLIEEISQDPLLAETKLIAEPWDADGIYRLGGFYPQANRWSEWNDKYRDSVRRFIKGDRGEKREFALRICGSQDLFRSRSPIASINFITAHDGFTLYDLVAYNEKHNSANAEDNRDGHGANMSWNCGAEGQTNNEEVLSLRRRQMKNLHLALLISQGIPMLLMGDEYGHTRHGNNNTWCQDNELNWFLWNRIEEEKDFFRFYRKSILFRKSHPVFRKGRFLTDQDIHWHSIKPFEPDWAGDTQMIAFTLIDEENNDQLYIAFNVHHTPLTLSLPPAPNKGKWRVIANTANPAPQDFFDEENAPPVEDPHFELPSHSSIVLKA